MTRVGVYGALVLLAVALVLVPIVGGATVCVDDFAWIRIAHGSESLWRALLDAWPRQLFFRPIDVVANRLVEPRTLMLAPLLTVQACGLALVSLGVLRLLGRCGGRDYPARAAALAWLWMHPATQLSVWSAGCSSQTWCAAAGILTTVMLLERPRGQGAEYATLGLLAGTSALGVICKELFVGWATALALLAWAIDPAHDGPGGAVEALKRSAPRMLALLVPPAAWIAARWLSSNFGDISSAETGLYAFQGPLQVATNSAISLLGMFVQGPVHWARLLGWPWNLVPFVGAGLSLWCAWEGGRLVDSCHDAVLPRRLLPWFVGIGLVAVWPALVIRHVSELYLFGPNALVAVLVGLGIDAGWRRTAEPWRGTWRLFGACLLVVAATGFISRSRHFLATWEYARVLREEVYRSTANLEKERINVRIPAALYAGPMHSKYCVPPAIAAALPEAWSSRRLVDDDGPLILFVDERDEHAAPPSSEDLRLRPEIRPREIW